jgi:hypothetical protein
MKKQPNKGGIYFPITAVQVGHTHFRGNDALAAAAAALAAAWDCRLSLLAAAVHLLVERTNSASGSS